jgi:hypothetical protein
MVDEVPAPPNVRDPTFGGRVLPRPTAYAPHTLMTQHLPDEELPTQATVFESSVRLVPTTIR